MFKFRKSQKKIFIPDNESYIGGPKTFLTNLGEYFKKNSIEITDELKKAALILFPVAYDKERLLEFKKNGGKIIQRLDGIYYPSKHNPDELEFNKVIQDIYLEYSDYVIFQSEYSKAQCFKMLGVKSSDNYSIIINGVNKDIFYPAEENIIKDEIQLISTGNFRNIDMIEPIVLALDTLADKYKFKLNIAGRISNPELKKFFDRKYISLKGELDLGGVSQELRSNNIFLYSHLNPPCPNSVIEAISSGLPVVGFDSGSMSELLPFSTDLLAKVSDDLFQVYKDFDSRKLAEKIEYLFNNFEKYSNTARDNSKLYDFQECGNSYVNVFNKIL